MEAINNEIEETPSNTVLRLHRFKKINASGEVKYYEYQYPVLKTNQKLGPHPKPFCKSAIIKKLQKLTDEQLVAVSQFISTFID